MSKPHLASICLLAALLVPMAGCETPPRHGDAHDRQPEVRVVFSGPDIAHIRDFYKPRHPHGGPPGLARQGRIPPGQMMKLRRGEPYPPGYAWHPLPRDLDNRLSPLPHGYLRVIVGSDIGILDIRTRIVVDLLEDMAD